MVEAQAPKAEAWYLKRVELVRKKEGLLREIGWLTQLVILIEEQIKECEEKKNK